MDILQELRRVIRLEGQAIAHLEESIGLPFEEAVKMLQACQGKVAKNTIYTNVYDGVEGMFFIEQSVASSADGGAWLPMKHPAARR
jgi:hypothetical protein